MVVDVPVWNDLYVFASKIPRRTADQTSIYQQPPSIFKNQASIRDAAWCARSNELSFKRID